MEYLSILEYDALNIDKQLVTEISEKLSPPPTISRVVQG